MYFISKLSAPQLKELKNQAKKKQISVFYLSGVIISAYLSGQLVHKNELLRK